MTLGKCVKGATTRYAYDVVGGHTKVTDALGGEARRTFDLVGNMPTSTDPYASTVNTLITR